MKPWTAIVAWTDDNRVAKYQDFDTEADAQAHVERARKRFPAAFVARTPSANDFDWLVDPATKSVRVSPPPPPPVEPDPLDVLEQELSAANNIAAIKAALINDIQRRRGR